MKKAKEYTLGVVIAKRELEFKDKGIEKKIIIKIGKPKKDKEISDGYYCPFMILGIGKENVQVAFGEDSIQALELAYSMIGALMVLYYQKLHPHKITWNGDSRLGFPLPDTPEDITKKEMQWMKIKKK